jgi:hypothetical protein
LTCCTPTNGRLNEAKHVCHFNIPIRNECSGNRHIRVTCGIVDISHAARPSRERDKEKKQYVHGLSWITVQQVLWMAQRSERSSRKSDASMHSHKRDLQAHTEEVSSLRQDQARRFNYKEEIQHCSSNQASAVLRI